ncbi:hypothetical protein AAVH_15695 [Aphelenchoides avenae]|nr:hypothetical protein AAVH_15695 [Aphelenchus avenae]
MTLFHQFKLGITKIQTDSVDYYISTRNEIKLRRPRIESLKAYLNRTHDSGDPHDFNPATDRTPSINLIVDCSAFDATRPSSESRADTVPPTQSERTRPASGGLDDFNPVTDEAPPANMDVSCSAFDATRSSSVSRADTVAAQIERTRPDSGGLDDFNPATDKAPPINLTVNCSDFDATHPSSRSNADLVHSTQNERTRLDSGGLDDFNPLTDEAPPINLNVSCSFFNATRPSSRSRTDTVLSARSERTRPNSDDSQDFNPATDKTPPMNLSVDCSAFDATCPSSRSNADTVTSTEGERTRLHSGDSQDFNPVTDKAPSVNMYVDCSAFDVTRLLSGSTMDTVSSARSERTRPDSTSSHDFNPVTDEAPPMNMSVDCSAFDATQPSSGPRADTVTSMRSERMRSNCDFNPVTDEPPEINMGVSCSFFDATLRASRLSTGTALSTQCGDENALKMQEEQGQAALDPRPARAHHRDTSAANALQPKAYLPLSKGPDLPQNVELSQVESETARSRKPIVPAGGHARCSLFAHGQQRFENHSPSPTFNLTKNPSPKPGHVVGADDELPGPHRSLLLAKSSTALRSIADEYYSDSSSSDGASVRETASLQRTHADRGYVSSPVMLQAGSTFKSRLPLASNDARLDLSIVSKTVITNGTRTAIISSLPQLSKHVATPEKAKPQLRFDNDTSFEESTSDDDGVERTLWARQADDSLDTWRSRPRIVDYASTTSDDASLETTVDSAGFSNTQSFYGQTLGRPQAQRHNEFAHGRRRTNDDLRGVLVAPSLGPLRDLNDDFDTGGASSNHTSGMSLSSSGGLRDSGVSAVTRSSLVHVVAKRGRPEQIKLLTPKIRNYALRKDNILNGGKSDVPVQTDDGVPLRRSTRNRVSRLSHHLGQRAWYQADDSGNFSMVGVTSVVVNDPLIVKALTVNPAEAVDRAKKNGAKRAQAKTRNHKRAPKEKRGLESDMTVDDE